MSPLKPHSVNKGKLASIWPPAYNMLLARWAAAAAYGAMATSATGRKRRKQVEEKEGEEEEKGEEGTKREGLSGRRQLDSEHVLSQLYKGQLALQHKLSLCNALPQSLVSEAGVLCRACDRERGRGQKWTVAALLGRTSRAAPPAPADLQAPSLSFCQTTLQEHSSLLRCTAARAFLTTLCANLPYGRGKPSTVVWANGVTTAAAAAVPAPGCKIAAAPGGTSDAAAAAVKLPAPPPLTGNAPAKKLPAAVGNTAAAASSYWYCSPAGGRGKLLTGCGKAGGASASSRSSSLLGGRGRSCCCCWCC